MVCRYEHHVRVGSSLQCRESHSHDKHGSAEASEALLDTRGPEQQAANGEHGQACHEGNAETVASQDPARDGQGAQKIGTKVRGGQARGHGGGNIEKVLKVGVEGIEETIGEAPKEEQNCH